MLIQQKLLFAAIVIVFATFISDTFSYELILDRVEQVGTKDYIDSTGVKIRKVGKDRKLFGKFAILQPLNDSIILKLDISKKTGSGWNILPFKIDKPICTFFKEDQYFYPDLLKFSTFPDPMPCPVPAETFEVKEWEISLEKVPPMLLKHGDYKVNIVYSLGSTNVYGLVIYASINNMLF